MKKAVVAMVGFDGTETEIIRIIPIVLQFALEAGFKAVIFHYLGKKYVPKKLLSGAMIITDSPIFSFEKRFTKRSIKYILLCVFKFGFVRLEIRKGKSALYINSSRDVFFVGLSKRDFGKLKQKFSFSKFVKNRTPFNHFSIKL